MPTATIAVATMMPAMAPRDKPAPPPLLAAPAAETAPGAGDRAALPSGSSFERELQPPLNLRYPTALMRQT